MSIETDNPPKARRAERKEGSGGRRHPVLLVVLGLLVLVLLFGALVAVSALGVRSDLNRGRAEMVRGKKALLSGDAEGAAEAFRRAGRDFEEGAHGARSPWLSALGQLPVAGRTSDAIRGVADAGVKLAAAGETLSSAVSRSPGGLAGLGPTDKGIPIERLEALASPAEKARDLSGKALETLEATPASLLPPPVREAREQALADVEQLHRQLVAGADVLRGLPAFLGANGASHYFFGAANPAEERGTGGLIGAYSILTIDDGKMSFSDFKPIQKLPAQNVHDVPAPSEDYAKAFNFYRTHVGFWLNANMPPDFPLSAKALALSYKHATGKSLDGVIVADPFALESLMRVTPAISVPGTGFEVSRKNVVGFVTNKAYALFDSNSERKLVLGKTAEAVLDRFLAAQGSISRIKALLGAFKDGHVKVWTGDSEMQRGLALTATGGAFSPRGTDAFAVITNSFSGTKLDFWQERTITYDVQLGPGGSGAATLRVALENGGPTSGYPPYVIGPYKNYSRKPGQNVTSVDVYCDRDCLLQGATRNGEPVKLDHFRVGGYPFYEDYVRTDAGETSTLVTQLLLPKAWRGDDLGGEYQLSFVGQTTIKPVKLRILIHPPPGMHVTSYGEDLRREGDLLVYEGSPRGNLDLRTTFAPSLPIRIWRESLDLVS